MPLISARCTNCGANLEVDNTKDAAICPYCGSAYIVEKAVNYYNSTNNITANVVNVYGGNSVDFEIRAGTLVKYNGASTKAVVPNTVKIIGTRAFYGCQGLEEVVIPEGVTEISNEAFYACSRLARINLPESIAAIGYAAFSGCAGLESVALPKGIERIESWAFYQCSGLRQMIVPSGVKVIGDLAFGYCTGLREITIPDSVVQASHNILEGCGALERINASEEWKRNHPYVSPLLSSYSQESKKGGCYIATAVYGSYDCPQVWTLRRYRDCILGTRVLGRAFIRAYYAVSPTLVKMFGSADWFKKLWRGRLDRLVERLQSEGISSEPYEDRDWN